jgi:hypothetical protein
MEDASRIDEIERLRLEDRTHEVRLYEQEILRGGETL